MPTHVDSASLLKDLALFSALDSSEIDKLAVHVVQRRALTGERLFERGDACNGFHLLVEGIVKLVVSNAEGAEHIVNIVQPGHSFGEACMFLGQPYMVNAEVVSDALLLRIPKQAVMEEIERNPEFAKHMLGGISQRLHQLVGDFEALALRSATQRVAHYLLRCAEAEHTEKDEFRLSISKGLIAAHLHITREHFSRVLHRLVAQNIVSVNGKVIRLLDRERLTHYAA